MFKKLLSILGLGLLVSTGVSAQYYSMSPANDTITVNTTGQGNYNSGENSYSNTIDLSFHINNSSDSSLTFKWQLLSDSTEHPAGWLLTGICDNVICRSPYSAFYYHEEQTSFPILPGETNANKTLLEARIYAPVGSADGIGVFRVKVRAFYSSDAGFANPLQTKTVVFIVKKNVTAIATIQADDKRVTLYPNPATNTLQVYADKNLNPQSISIMNISGAQSITTAVEKGKETTNININSLAAGIYTVRITDTNGNMITTRKFVKK
jgi:hypothetical protein